MQEYCQFLSKSQKEEEGSRIQGEVGAQGRERGVL